jgi:leader peptidase (prepilin peptidase)/N-methyltransferase
VTVEWALSGVFALLAGLSVGSFMTVAILRLPEDRSLWTRSACEVCAAPIAPRDNVPVLSFLLLGGRCRTCSAPIPRWFPFVEILGGMLALLCWRRFVPDAASVDLAHGAAASVYFLFLCALAIGSFVDLRHHILPDETTVYLVPFALLAAAGLGALGFDEWPYVSWKLAFLGAAVWGGFLAVVSIGFEWVLGREALGWGDVKLIALVGAFLGPMPGTFLALLVGSLVGALVGAVHLLVTRERAYLPTGPALALGAAASLLYGDVILRGLFPGMSMVVDRFVVPG